MHARTCIPVSCTFVVLHIYTPLPTYLSTVVVHATPPHSFFVTNQHCTCMVWYTLDLSRFLELPEFGSLLSARRFTECFLSGTPQKVVFGKVLLSVTTLFAESRTLGTRIHSAKIRAALGKGRQPPFKADDRYLYREPSSGTRQRIFFAECPPFNTRQNIYFFYFANQIFVVCSYTM
jgi:hypothetical protein